MSKRKIEKPNENIQAIFTLIGPSGSGKTAFFRQLVLGQTFCPQSFTTTGVETGVYEVEINNENFNILFCDTSGSEYYEATLKLLMRKSDAIIFFYDITSSKKTIEYLGKRITEINEMGDKKKELTCFLLGTKLDLNKERQVKTEAFKKFCQKNNEKIKFVNEISLATISQKELKTLVEGMASKLDWDELKKKKKEKKIEDDNTCCKCIIS